MKDIVITSDSTCDLSRELIAENGIAIMPLSVTLGGKTYKDGIDIVPADIFRYFDETGELPKTAAPSVEEYEQMFRSFTDRGSTVIHFNISSKASGSHGFALAAAKKIGGNQTVLTLREKVNTSFIPDTLLYLYKGGRCSTLSYYGAKVLSIHPMIDMKEGQLYPKKKYMGKMARCIRSYVNDLAAAYPNYDRTRCFVTHSCADAELVELAKNMVRELFRFDTIIETVAGSIITSHCGRNTLGVLFISE